MKVVLDTNVIVSAVLSRGSPPDLILRAWRRGAFQLVASRLLLDELEVVLSRPHVAERLGWSLRQRGAFIAALEEGCVIVAPERVLRAVQRDPPDNRVLEAAVAARADYVVSGDQHLLELRSYEGTAIVSPTRFAAVLAATSPWTENRLS
jgi:putative PIN family toxin of toxin-antitoxin system